VKKRKKKSQQCKKEEEEEGGRGDVHQEILLMTVFIIFILSFKL